MAATEDRFLAGLARFAHGAPVTLDAGATRAAKVAVMDTLAVALGALAHPAAIVARKYARHSAVASGASLWGSGTCVTAETAALVNGVPLRGYDYNDLYIGKSGGHPSDLIPGVLALAEWRRLPGRAALGSIALGYEVTLALFDHLDMHAGGWDYPNVVAIGATAACARLLGLSETATREALAITVIAHLASDEVESGELNARGDLTMWKRFNGSDAIRQAIYATLLAEAGAEGAVRPFEGRTAFLSKLGAGSDPAGVLARLAATTRLARVGEVTFKRWPVGSRAQSAIQAALEARAQVPDVSAIRAVDVRADPQVYDHLIARRDDPYRPHSRETADHSLAYVVAAAVVDGRIGTDSFDPARVTDPALQAFLQAKVKCTADPALAQGAAGGFLSSVAITLADGRVVTGAAKPPPGHVKQPFTDAEFDVKLAENVEPLFGAQRTEAIRRAVWALDESSDVGALCRQLVLPAGHVLLN